MISISETKRNHIGQDLGNTGGEVKQLHVLFLSSNMLCLLQRSEHGHCHVKDGHV